MKNTTIYIIIFIIILLIIGLYLIQRSKNMNMKNNIMESFSTQCSFPYKNEAASCKDMSVVQTTPDECKATATCEDWHGPSSTIIRNDGECGEVPTIIKCGPYLSNLCDGC